MSEEELKAKSASQDRHTLIRLASTFPAGDGMRRAILSGLQTRERKTATEQKVAASQWVGYVEDSDGYMTRFFGPSSKGGISGKMKNLPSPKFDWGSGSHPKSRPAGPEGEQTMVNLDMTMNDLYSFLHRKPSDVWFRNLPPKEKKVLDGLLAEYKAQGRFASGQEARIAAKLTQQKIKDAIKNNSEILRQIKSASDVDPKWVSALEKQIAGLSELLEQAEMKRAIQASAKTAGHPLGDRAAVNKETASLLKGWVAGGVRDWEKVTAKFYLNDLSKAHDQISDFEKALGRMQNGITDLYSDYIQHSDYEEFYDELTDSGFYGLETAIEEAEHDLTQMIDRGWADDGYEDDVQQEIEDSILPDLERAMDDFKQEFGRPPRVASKRAAKEPWKHWGETREKMLGYAKAEMKRLKARSPDDLRKARKKHKPSLPSDGSSGQYDAWTETLAQVLEMGE